MFRKEVGALPQPSIGPGIFNCNLRGRITRAGNVSPRRGPISMKMHVRRWDSELRRVTCYMSMLQPGYVYVQLALPLAAFVLGLGPYA